MRRQKSMVRVIAGVKLHPEKSSAYKAGALKKI
jgi:hypothetical protein